MMRGGGATTDQLKQAPAGALYICSSGALPYTNALLHYLGRDRDVTISTPNILARDGHSLRGRRFTAIIIDHAAELTDREWAVVAIFRDAIAARMGVRI